MPLTYKKIKNIGNEQINYVSNSGGKSTWELPRWQVGTVVELLRFATGSLQASELTGAICWVAPTWHMNASRLQFSRIAESHTAESLFPLAVPRRIHRGYVLIQDALYRSTDMRRVLASNISKMKNNQKRQAIVIKSCCETK